MKINELVTKDKLIEDLHDKSMSTNVKEAAFGRLSKVLMPALLEWIDDEQERGTDSQTIMDAYLSVSGKTSVSVCELIMSNENLNRELFKKAFAEALKSSFLIQSEFLKKIVAELTEAG